MTSPELTHRFCVAPMMAWTDRHCRTLHRVLSRCARLYTEMVTADAVLHGPRERLLAFSPAEHPVALQLGGCDPAKLAHAAKCGEERGYAEINLNVGCPSDRVQNGRFGACLMAEPDVVGACVAAMKAAVCVPVTVKCRLGIDEQDTQAALDRLTASVTKAGVDALIVHARKAWLKGLSPLENRSLPPLDYQRVYRLKQDFPQLPVIINGGIANLEEAAMHLHHVDGVMLGRAAYHTPWILHDVDRALFQKANPCSTPLEAAADFEIYMQTELARGTRLADMTRHALTLFHGQHGARAFRRTLSQQAAKENAGIAAWHAALSCLADSRHHFISA